MTECCSLGEHVCGQIHKALTRSAAPLQVLVLHGFTCLRRRNRTDHWALHLYKIAYSLNLILKVMRLPGSFP